MKRECAVVQDLLVLYEDDVLKEESRQMIEEHIRGCEECMQIYETAGKKFPDIEGVPEASESEQETAAIRILKKVKKRITHKAVIAAALAACMILVITDGIFSQITDTWGGSGITAIFTLIPTKNIHVTELYELKNGDIYCMLDFDKGFTISAIADWVIPNGQEDKNTAEAVKELRFKREPWRIDLKKTTRLDIIFSLKRHGTVEGSSETITHSCAEINVYGKTPEDKLTIWKAGQKIKEAPENIEKKAVQAYIQEGQIAKAMEECDNMGWTGYEKIIDNTGLSRDMETYEVYPSVIFASEENSIILYHTEGL